MTYTNILLSITLGIVLVPYVINKVGLADYGLWAVVLELVGYLALTELGVFGVIPLRLAQADGANDQVAARRLVANGLTFAVAAGLMAGVATAFCGADVLDWLPGVNPEQANAGRGPLMLLFGLTAVALPLKVFAAVLAGLQDAFVGGLLRLAQSLLTLMLTVGLLESGAGLYALAAGAVVPPLATGLVAAGRVWRLAPHLLVGLPQPGLQELGRLARDGFGYWIGGFGFGLMTASNGLFILLATGRQDLVTAYVCMAKLPMLLHNLSRIPHESSTVGLAQLYAVGDPTRTAAVVTRLVRVQAIMTGGAVTLALTVNPAFASRWYPVPYAGDAAHLAIVSAAVVLSLVLVFAGEVNAVDKFLVMGFATLANGMVYAALAVPAVARLGLCGLAAALAMSAAVTTLAVGMYWHRRLYRLGPADWAVVAAAAGRFVPVWLLAGWAGIALQYAPVWQVAGMTAVVGLAALVAAGPTLRELPWPSTVRWLLTRARLLPANG